MESCGKKNSQCSCTLDKDKCDGRHLCMIDACGGSWKGDGITCKQDILLIPSSWNWPQHIERSANLLEMDAGSASIAMILMDLE